MVAEEGEEIWIIDANIINVFLLFFKSKNYNWKRYS